jgi:hypothetical protein
MFNCTVFFLSQFLVIKTLDSDSDPDSMNPDPQHWNLNY